MSIRAVAYDLPENESRELLAHGVNPINIESGVVDLRHVGAAALRQRSGAWGSARCDASGPHGVWRVGAGRSR